jgi:hypothetical protein
VKSGRELAAIGGKRSPDSCLEAVANYTGFSARAREILLNTRVDAVRVSGERATATAHTSAVINRVVRQVPPVNIPCAGRTGTG